MGIDFGHAFGSATQFLGIPEMMPFRMTRQMTSVVKPHPSSGVIKCTMVAALSALKVLTRLCLT